MKQRSDRAPPHTSTPDYWQCRGNNDKRRATSTWAYLLPGMTSGDFQQDFNAAGGFLVHTLAVRGRDVVVRVKRLGRRSEAGGHLRPAETLECAKISLPQALVGGDGQTCAPADKETATTAERSEIRV